MLHPEPRRRVRRPGLCLGRNELDFGVVKPFAKHEIAGFEHRLGELAPLLR